ncbi:MAG: class I SAM-dependent methyltransferase [Vicinamibacterales bacterium]
MNSWRRVTDLAPPEGSIREIWQMVDGDSGRVIESYPVQVRRGKPFDVLRSAGTNLRSLSGYADVARRAAHALYASVPGRHVERCPCCAADARTHPAFSEVYGATYRRCPDCRHVYVNPQPSVDALTTMFATADDFAREYTNADELEFRLREIIAPKLSWAREVYSTVYGCDLASVLDVGAGGGHFVAGCRRAGLTAEGIEINTAAASFASRALNVSLHNIDFLTAPAVGRFDLVTLWGVLEYVPEPGQFVRRACEAMSDRGLLVVEVPRADCLSTAVQREFPDQVWRHMSPATHVNLFSDASLATLLRAQGLRPVAVWTFGMDAYELVTQLATTLADQSALERLARVIGPLQQFIDSEDAGDDLLVAAVPINAGAGRS